MEFFLDLTIPQWVIILSFLSTAVYLLTFDVQRLSLPERAQIHPWLRHAFMILVMGVLGMVICASVFLFLLATSYEHVAIWVGTVSMTVVTCKALEVYRLSKNLQ